LATAAFGTLMQIGDGAGPENFTTIAEVKDITPPPLTRDTVDVTHHTSAGGWEQVVATIKRSGVLTFEANWIPSHATQSFAAGLGLDFNNGTLRNFKIVFPTGNSWILPGLVVGFNPAATVGGVLGLSISIKVSGQPTLA